MSDTQYVTIVAAIQSDMATGTGLANVLDYEPQSFAGAPLIYFILDGFEFIDAALQEQGIRWTWNARLVVPYLNNRQAEATLAGYVVDLLRISGTDLDAGGAIPVGNLLIATSGKAKYIVQGGAKYRALDFVITADEFIPYPYAN